VRTSVLFIERYAKLSLIISVFLLVACVKQTRTEDRLMARYNKYEQQAQQLFAQGKYQQAATLFQRLASKPSARQNVFRLQAAHALVSAEEYGKAKTNLDLIMPAQLNAQQVNQLHLLYAQVYLSSGHAEQAIKRLQLISFSSLNNMQRRSYYELSAFAYSLTGQALESVQQRIALDAYLSPGRKNENNIAIIEEFRFVPVDILERQLNIQQNFTYSGWLELAMLTTRFAKGTPEFIQAIDTWGLRYPQHPGQTLIHSGYFVPASIVLGDIRNIAVFLPESGPYSPYARAIKEGIMAAYRRYEQDTLQADIQFYDTRGRAIVPLYHQVVSQGVQLVIGPLNKKLVIELAENTDLTVPVLALNYVEGLIKENLYQFALSPIDEVQQVVMQAWSEGSKNAIILAPETVEGERIRNYFQNAWESLDGNVLAVQTFSSRTKDFSLPVKQMLNINESKYRFQKLSKVIGNVKNNPRRRQDVDVIFMVADNSVARLINPQFYHNRAQSVAVYGLAKVYTGKTEEKKDIDLEGVGFCSIPWLFDQAYQGDLDRQALQDIWQPLPDKFLSLIAFGVDAYTLPRYLNDLASIPYSGATGDLLLNKYNRIERSLVCAKFKNGKAVLVDTKREIAEDQEHDMTRAMPEW